ncbi:hypothetical protein TBLA_0B03220 [Henningerozyma blattae CBS 6284]|uniref:CTD kinase subunit gamma Ctk3 C-terminal domain-containing protein n=1 Tax=Henningerozyma blattae (strain ATCC 34711 / CBS 6284 / DSM 70876 / NBRC 10599 / NRRL Y-10934 / UCD 77-7) TaxID=1071380 RepID=I2GYG1_HENB6|nr:hypothetical protein TBLA_0B03220 [Tetrapisispora blattae CBS 6284]CCH59163.1 hypothetical protein TBLA_0B03220 [Tetrapisispora blattae CBS 6284]
MDSLEVRLQFIQILKNLSKTLYTITPSYQTQSTNNKYDEPIIFFLKNQSQYYEDLEQCLFDIINKMNPLDRINIVVYYLILMEILVSNSNSNTYTLPNITNQVKEMFLKFSKLYRMILPKDDIVSLSNLPIAKELYDRLQEVTQGLDTDIQNMVHECHTILLERLSIRDDMYKKYEQDGLVTIDTQNSQTTEDVGVQTVLHRMENDRERHKRSKEQQWVEARIDRNVLETSSSNLATTSSNSTSSSTDKNAADETEFDKVWANAGSGVNQVQLVAMSQLSTIATESLEG